MQQNGFKETKIQEVQEELHKLESMLEWCEKQIETAEEKGDMVDLPERWQKEINWREAAERWNEKNALYKFFHKKTNPFSIYENLDNVSLDDICKMHKR